MMTDDEVRRRCEEFLLTHDSACVPNLMQFYRAAMADGMERAARMLDNMDSQSSMINGQCVDDGGKTLTVASKRIRQAAKEGRDE